MSGCISLANNANAFLTPITHWRPPASVRNANRNEMSMDTTCVNKSYIGGLHSWQWSCLPCKRRIATLRKRQTEKVLKVSIAHPTRARWRRPAAWCVPGSERVGWPAGTSPSGPPSVAAAAPPSSGAAPRPPCKHNQKYKLQSERERLSASRLRGHRQQLLYGRVKKYMALEQTGHSRNFLLIGRLFSDQISYKEMAIYHKQTQSPTSNSRIVIRYCARAEQSRDHHISICVSHHHGIRSVLSGWGMGWGGGEVWCCPTLL